MCAKYGLVEMIPFQVAKSSGGGRRSMEEATPLYTWSEWESVLVDVQIV